MANNIETLTILDGTSQGRDIVIKINIIGDGSGDETLLKVFDHTAYSNTTVTKKVVNAQYCLNGFSASLFWGVNNLPSDNLIIACQADHYDTQEFERTVSSINNGGITDRDGDIYMSTIGLELNDTGYIVIKINNCK